MINPSIESSVSKAHRENGIPDDLPENSVRTLDDLFRFATESYADNPAYQCLGRVISYNDLDRLSDRFAAFLQSGLKLTTGDHVALHMPNLLQYPVAAIGALKAGMVLVNTNPLYTEEELLHQFRDADVKAVVTLANIAKSVESIVGELPHLKVIVTEVADLHTGFRRYLITGMLRYIRKQVPKLQIPNSVRFRKAMKMGATLNYQRHIPERDDIALLQYTGGTTGVAKGAMLTHASLTDCMLQCDWLYKATGMEKGSSTVVEPLPLYHIYAFSTGLTHVLYQGSKLLLITNPRDMDSFVKELIKNRFNGLFGLNTLFSALMNHPRFNEIDFTHAKLCVSGGMPLSAALAEKWKSETGVQISEGYGLTESSGVLSFNPPSDVRSGTAGIGFSGCQFKIEDSEKKSLGTNQEGELLFKGRQMMKGYWNRPEATAELLDEDGFMRTGDIARIDEDGYITICDRKKDMIIVSGFKIFPAEVEGVVAKIDGVLECAVVGEADEHQNEKVILCVVKTDETLTEETIIAYCRKHLTAYKVPRKVRFLDELPKSNVGKVLRRELRETLEKFGDKQG